MSWPLAYSTNAFTGRSLRDALEAIARLGYAGAEILCDLPHWRPDRVAPDELEAVADLLQTLGLGISNLNVNTANGYFSPLPPENQFEPSLASARPEWRRWRLAASIAALGLAARLGAPCISVTSGSPGTGGTPRRGLELLVDSLARLCEAAEPLGVRVGVEYEPGLLVERAGELAKVIQRVDSPLLGANLDIGHSWLCGEAPEAAVEALAGRIWNVHVEDIAARKHFHLVPGQGELPFRRYLDALARVGYRGFLTVELYTCKDWPEAAGRQALAYLTPLLNDDH